VDIIREEFSLESLKSHQAKQHTICIFAVFRYKLVNDLSTYSVNNEFPHIVIN